MVVSTSVNEEYWAVTHRSSAYMKLRVPSWRSGKRARLTCVQLRVRASLRANVLSLENLNVIIRAIN